MIRIKSLFLSLLFIFSMHSGYSQNANEDITHYTIHLDSINFTAKTISGYCQLNFTAVAGGLDTLTVSLLKLNVDSIVFSSSVSLSYLFNDTILKIVLPALVLPGDTQEVTVYYHGQPKMDPSGWGGFYFSGSYAFNLGVGFDSDPHNFGRAWFPCNDIFTDRASYSFQISTTSANKAFCNGILTSTTNLPNGNILWNWEMNDEIPTYLASMAIAPYYTLTRNYQSLPVEIACMPADSMAVVNTFTHLDTVLGFYIDAYGPYRFDKVGYCLIPFNSGAMEHATSIHIGRAFINGSLTYETLWAHELAHMWWGDWTTCATAGDMWLNEGFASFNEAYITEKLYGEIAYRDWIRSNHRKVLQFAHVNDGGYLPLINIPHEHTYGQTVYNKGANVAHTLRFYMGDSAFFNGCRAFMNNRGNSSVTSYDLRDELANSSGIPMNTFFNDWVFTPGFPHFSVDSLEVLNAGANMYVLHTRQKSKGNNHVYEMPVSIYFTDGITDTTLTVLLNDTLNAVPLTLSFTPQWIALDRFDHMSDAVSDFEKILFTTGPMAFPETFLSMNVQGTGNDTSILRVLHHWVAPDPFKSSTAGAGIRLSNYRYWSIEGLMKPGFSAQATLTYNGTLSTSAGYLDNDLITGNEDSLVLLFRNNAGDDWHLASGYTLTTGNKFDKIGSITVDTIRLGEYALGYRDVSTGINTNDKKNFDLRLYPNPSSGEVTILPEGKDGTSYLVCIYDSAGRNIYNATVVANQEITWRSGNHPSGTYLVKATDSFQEIRSKTIQLIK